MTDVPSLQFMVYGSIHAAVAYEASCSHPRPLPPNSVPAWKMSTTGSLTVMCIQHLRPRTPKWKSQEVIFTVYTFGDGPTVWRTTESQGSVFFLWCCQRKKTHWRQNDI